MTFFLRHPSLDELTEYAERPYDIAPRLRSHLETCARCQESLRFVEAMREATTRSQHVAPGNALRDRILESRTSGTRSIVPAADLAARPRRALLAPALVAAAVLVIVVSMSSRAPEAIASDTLGALTLTPAAPKRGEHITAVYVAPAIMQQSQWLVLRGRLRTPRSESYSSTVPTTTIGRLLKQKDGTYRASFTLPDSVVFAALGVEDSAAVRVDDNSGRAWELLVAGTDGRPLFNALDQRAKDLMGRSWEEGMATARKIVALYPNEIEAWSWLSSFENWMGIRSDSTVALHRAQLRRFDSMWRKAEAVPPEVIGRMSWYSINIDTAIQKYWQHRVVSEAPNESFAVQFRLLDLLDTLRKSNDTAAVMRQFDALWRVAPYDRRGQVANYVSGIPWSIGDTAAITLWAERAIAADDYNDAAARSVAARFAQSALMRDDGMRRLRRLLTNPSARADNRRQLGETAAQFRERMEREVQSLLASLGRALVDAGQTRAALDTLALAAGKGWSIDVARAIRTASLLAGDTATAMRMTARLVVDPRTTTSSRDSLQAFAMKRLSSTAWDAQVRAAREEFVNRMLGTASSRQLRGAVALTALDGQKLDLQGLVGDSVTVIAAWSLHCGPAREAMPELQKLTSDLASRGIRLVSIVDEHQPTKELTDFIAQSRLTFPVYLDAGGQASAALNQWGTPSFYVVDRQRHVRFGATSSLSILLARAEAVRLSGE